MIETPHRVRRHTEGDFAGRTEHFFPDADNRGLYELGDPALGREKHHKSNAIFTESVATAIYLVRTHGFSIRMRGDLTNQRNLIRCEEIRDL